MSDLDKSIATVKQAWINSSYYEDAEKWTGIFWKIGSDFRKGFDKLDVRRCAELACGHGRHAEQLMLQYGDRVEQLYCLDVVENNIDKTSNRLKRFDRVSTLLISGSNFEPIANNYLTSIFCYDAMVHFSPDIVESYLLDAFRVLEPGGRALFHHSNFDAPETGRSASKPYGLNPHARNHMTLSLFELLVKHSGLRILETKGRQWGGIPNLDRISLLERPIN